VGSPGPDGDLLSSGAIVLRGTLEEPAQADNQESWLAQRRAALDMMVDRTGGDGQIVLSRDHEIGGQLRLSGAAFFWFFTWLMLGTAIVFVPVAWLYRPHTYLQLEEE
ncbi:MAG: hypothetical protein MK100_10025, partial [Phycisphaerales bacterium]|nr:hypothetical protein [Phycisphaerales bacterium]